MRRFTIQLSVSASLIALGAGALQPAHAQTAAATTASANSATVADVIVTARRRSESLEKVPVAVAVIQGADARVKNLNNIEDLAASVPSIDFRTSASNKDRTIFVRGIGTISTSPGVEPSVSNVIDGVVYARSGQATVDFSDVDHIEVLEGPQGTLFGKNATAGVINIVTRDPTRTLSGYFDGAYYGGEEYRVAAGVSGPLGDKVRALLAVFDGGYRGNVFDNFDQKWVNGYQRWGARAKVTADLTDNLTFTLGVDYSHEHDTTPNGIWVSPSQAAYPTGAITTKPGLGAAIATAGITPGSDNLTVSTNVTSRVTDVNDGISGTFDWRLPGDFKLTSITAYRHWGNVQYQDFDNLPAPSPGLVQANDTGHLSFHQISEELRVASPKGHLIDYVAGLFFIDEVDNETYERDDTSIIGGLPTAASGFAVYGTEDRNYALFGEANVNFTSRFRMIIGARGIHDDLNFHQSRVDAPNANPGAPGIAGDFSATGSVSKSGWAGRAGLQYDFTPDVNAYFTVSRGYMGPAFNVFFNMGAANTPPLNPETSTSYEIGVKSRLFDDHVQANLAAFITDFQNFQANFTQLVNGAQVTNLINAGSVTSRGVELSVIAKLWDAFTLSGDAAYDDAYVVNFPCPAGAAISCNINGQPMPFAPRWKTNIDADYHLPVGGRFILDFDTDWSWQSKTQFQLSETPDTIQPAYGIWNASIGLIDRPGGWSARLVIKNIADTHYSPFIAHGNIGGLVRWAPRDDSRYVGANVHKDF